ncbi:PEP-CTERM sorting domain-containing protein [Rhodopirellula sallentina]|uniref:PEP-CTERM sorting domain-containing protein n=1 Tax=Rhodopirellula sallentina TaxID=1263869 RepID=UPI001360B4D6|nr:PEP-CTERM sorting domain-containing protein [Rhodopirellula sallentina]
MVIDDFSSTTLGTRASAVFPGTVTTTGSYDATGFAFAQLEYTFDESVDFSPSSVIALEDFASDGSGTISLIAKSASGNVTTTAEFTDATSGRLAFGFEPGELSAVDSLTFNLQSDPFGSQIDLSFSSVQAVPEPTSIALVSLAGLGGLAVRRRRKLASA